MTDEEIKKALECCSITGDCDECPLYNFTELRTGNCVRLIISEAHGFTKRQQAEIEQWKEEANRYQNLWCIAVDDIEKSKSEAIKEFKQRLENKRFFCDLFGDGLSVGYVAIDVDRIIEEMTEGGVKNED